MKYNKETKKHKKFRETKTVITEGIITIVVWYLDTDKDYPNSILTETRKMLDSLGVGKPDDPEDIELPNNQLWNYAWGLAYSFKEFFDAQNLRKKMAKSLKNRHVVLKAEHLPLPEDFGEQDGKHVQHSAHGKYQPEDYDDLPF